MGKKKITNKFAQTKRIISTQDQRMYPSIDAVNRIRQKSSSMIGRGNKQWINKHLAMLKSNKCTNNYIQTQGALQLVLHA